MGHSVVPYSIGAYISISQVESSHKGHFFDPDTLRFFSSRISSEVLPVGDGWLFITSEQDKFVGGPRLYTIRKLVHATRGIESVGGFQHYETMRRAKREMRKLHAAWKESYEAK